MCHVSTGVVFCGVVQVSQMPLTAAEKMRKYRERLKEDPVKRQQYLTKRETAVEASSRNW